MINLLSIRCRLAFAPYLMTSLAEFIREATITSRVVRQGGMGLIVRSDGLLIVRHQNRQEEFDPEIAKHYYAAIGLREGFFQVVRMEDEVVMANIGHELLLSHPQSELWLKRETLAALLETYRNATGSHQPVRKARRDEFPEWLSVSSSAGRLLLSDQRSGRWVLLGEDHVTELERRIELLTSREEFAATSPPTISLKGVTVYLQSALTLADTLDVFASEGRIEEFTHRAPHFALSVRRGTQGLELSDENSRVAITAKEAGKWVDIIRVELARLNCTTVSRGRIRTVFADAEAGRWVLQWGDEVLVPPEAIHPLLSQRQNGLTTEPSVYEPAIAALEVKQAGDFVVLLAPSAGSCVALQKEELDQLLSTNTAGSASR